MRDVKRAITLPGAGASLRRAHPAFQSACEAAREAAGIGRALAVEYTGFVEQEMRGIVLDAFLAFAEPTAVKQLVAPA
jgi:hypothetical protein